MTDLKDEHVKATQSHVRGLLRTMFDDTKVPQMVADEVDALATAYLAQSACIKELEAKLAQQDDLVQAAVAAALREAAERMDNGFSYNAGNRVRALITPDAQAALDRVVEKRIEELEAKLARVIAAYRIEAMRRHDYSHAAFDQHIEELNGQNNE